MRRTSMLRPIINVLLVSALLTVGLTATVALAAPGIKGCSGNPEEGIVVENCQTGSPEETAPAEGFGATTSQRASTVHDIGEHSSDQVEPRKGVGNVARTDADLAKAINTLRDLQDPNNTEPDVVDTGARVGDHGCLIGELDDAIGQDDEGVTDCTADPGNPDKPGKGRS